MTSHALAVAVVVASLIGALLAVIVMRSIAAAKARNLRRIREIAIEVFRKGALRESRSALAAITRYPHDMEHVQKVAAKGLADSAMPAHLAEDGER